MNKPLLVIKLGTSSITLSDGRVNEDLIASIAQQCEQLSGKYHLLIVSSGAVGLGRLKLQRYSGKLTERKAAAAIGNPELMRCYSKAFQVHGISIAQSLCERGHFSDRQKFLELRETFETLWQNDIIPIANENDVVSSLELKRGFKANLAVIFCFSKPACYSEIALACVKCHALNMRYKSTLSYLWNQ